MNVIRLIARLNVGGPARHVTLLSEAFAERGHRAVLVYGSLADDEGSLEKLARSQTYRAECLSAMGRRISVADDLRALGQILKILRRERPDVVHTHTSKAGTLGRLAAFIYNAARPRSQRCLVVHTFHGHVFHGYFGPLSSFAVRWLERRLATVTDAIVAISPSQHEDLTTTYRIAPPDKVHVIPLGLELDLLRRVDRQPQLRSRYGFGLADTVVLFVGRLVPIKRVDVLLQAIAAANARGTRVRLLVAGDGECRSELERMARDLNLESSVRFLGWVHDLPDLYAAADIAALSSDNEGTPVALIEAAAAGLSVVATRVGGVPDVVVDGRHGRLVPAGDMEALVRGLMELSADADLRAAMGAAARREVADRYDMARLVADLTRLYESKLRRKRGSTVSEPAAAQAGHVTGSGGSP